MPASITRAHWAVLLLGCAIVVGNYYVYDLPASLNVPLRAWLDEPYAAWQFWLNAMYTMYSVPNIVLPVVGGVLVDRLGPRTTVLVFSTLVLAGAGLFALGTALKSLPLMLTGRALGGLGGESLEVAGTTITTAWFSRSYLSAALGVNLSASRISAAVQDAVSPWIATRWGVLAAVLAGVVLCVASLGCAVALVRIDSPACRTLHLSAATDDDESVTIRESRASPHDSLLSDSASSGSYSAACLDDNGDNENLQDTDVESTTRKSCSASQPLPRAFWLLCAVTFVLYGSVMPFIHVSSDFLQSKWFPGNVELAGALMGIPDLVCAFATPALGLLVDRTGNPARMVPLSASLVLVAHEILHLTSWPPQLGLVVLGLGSAGFAASVWPCVPQLVPAARLGTAYGAMTVALNVALAAVPLGVARLRAGADSFAPVGTMFLATSALGFMMAAALVWCVPREPSRQSREITPLLRDEDEATVC